MPVLKVKSETFGPILFHNSNQTMKEIVIRVEDSVYEQVMGMLALCPQVEVLGTSDKVEPRSLIDQCMAEAIAEVCNDKTVYKRSSDLAYIMIGANDGAIKDLDFFLTVDDYTGYLAQIGIEPDKIPKRSTIYNKVNATIGKFPDWKFVGNVKPKEALRRKNVFTRFSSAYFRIKHQKLDSFLDK